MKKPDRKESKKKAIKLKVKEAIADFLSKIEVAKPSARAKKTLRKLGKLLATEMNKARKKQARMLKKKAKKAARSNSKSEDAAASNVHV